MSTFNKLQDGKALWLRRSGRTALVAALAVVISGCFFNKVQMDTLRNGTYSAPWWCAGSGGAPQNYSTCQTFSRVMDLQVNKAYRKYPTANDLPGTAVQPVSLSSYTNLGTAYVLDATLPTTFQGNKPNVYMYDGPTGDARVAGFGYLIDTGDTLNPPDGFAGDRDNWAQDGTTSTWFLPVWILRGYENHPNIFASGHPCLNNVGHTGQDANSACFTASHTEPLEIVVTNDDGYNSDGIKALVSALLNEPNVSVQVIAPGANQSGSGNSVGTAPFVSTLNTITLADHPLDPQEFTAVWQDVDSSGTYNAGDISATPADSVDWAISVMMLTPDVIISGTNKGQNVGQLSNGSGTVGAARNARNNGVPAIATSTGGVKLIAGPHDFEEGASRTIDFFRAWRLGQVEHRDTWNTVNSINIPSCELGFQTTDGFGIRGVVQTELMVGGCIPAAATNYMTCDPLNPGDSESDPVKPAAFVVVDGDTDVQAFNNGYVGITNVTAEYPPLCP